MKKLGLFLLPIFFAVSGQAALTSGRVVKASSGTTITDSIIRDNGSAVAIGTDTVTGATLTVNGVIKSLTGGFVFPDGSTQTVSGTPFTGTANRFMVTSSGGAEATTALATISGSTVTISRLDPGGGLGGGFSSTGCGIGGCYLFEKGGSLGVLFQLPVTLGDDANTHSIVLQGKLRVYSSAGAPAANPCGTSPSVTGTDNAFRVTVGTADPNSCTMTFASTWTLAPICVATSSDETALISMSTLSATAVVLDWADAQDMSGDTVSVHCIGVQ